MFFIVELDDVLIEKYGLRLLERDSVLFLIYPVLGFMLFKRNHTYSVCTSYRLSIRALTMKLYDAYDAQRSLRPNKCLVMWFATTMVTKH